MKEHLHPRARMEEGLHCLDLRSDPHYVPKDYSGASVAISLVRIADALEKIAGALTKDSDTGPKS
jgi:hypothetical protein